MSISIRALALFFLCGNLCAQRPIVGPAPATVSKVNIRVRLLAPSATPPAGILVVLENQSGSEISRVMTDSRGVAEFTGLDPGLYRAHVQQHGFHSAIQSVDVSMSPSATVILDLFADSPSASPLIPPNGPAETVSANVPTSDAAKKLLEKGEGLLFDKKDPKASLPYFDRLVKSESQYANGWVLRGMALMQMQRPLDAEASFRKAIAAKPSDYAAHFALGVSLNSQNRFKEAMDPLKESLRLNPDSAEANYEISRSYLGIDQWQEAEKYIVRGLELNERFAPLHVAMGNEYLKKQDPQRALNEYDRYLQLAPDGIFASDVKRVRDGLKRSLEVKQK